MAALRSATTGWEVVADSTLEEAKGDMKLKHANKYESLDKVGYKSALDIEIFGGCALVVVWSMDKTKVVEVYHKDFSGVRVKKDGTGYLYSPDWADKKPMEIEGAKEYKPFNVRKPGGTQMLYYTEYRPNMDAYPLPGYIGAIPYCEIDFEISNFHLNNIKNGFWGSFLINFLNGHPNPEEKDELEASLIDKFGGSDNAGRFIMNFADGAERAATLESLQPARFDQLFDQLNNQVQQEIFTGHRVTSPFLFGVKTPGQLGGRTEMLESYELFKNTYCKPKQRNLEGVFTPIWRAMGCKSDLHLKEMPPMMTQFGESFLQAVLPAEELADLAREQLGIATEKQQFAKVDSDEGVLDLFRSVGASKKNYNVLRSREAFGMEESYAAAFLTELQSKVLDLLSKDPNMPAEEVAKALDITKSSAKGVIKRLTTGGYITPEGVTDTGDEALLDDPSPLAEIEVLYSYEWRPPWGDKDAGSSRDFCKQLLSLDKLYTRGEIDIISAAVGRNVWEMRGGWYTRSDNSRVPFCRHVWQQNIVQLK
jgi:DNA-binding Lrp family transcriptional regulator